MPQHFPLLYYCTYKCIQLLGYLSSGATVTYAHHALIEGNRRAAIVGTGLTIVLAIVFTGLGT
jgi:heme/copper-type cytochrome/quinol oxidase subunit 3